MRYKWKVDRNNYKKQFETLNKLFTLYNFIDYEDIDEDELSWIKEHLELDPYFLIEEKTFCSYLLSDIIPFENYITIIDIKEIQIETLKVKKLENSLVLPDNIIVLQYKNMLTFYEIIPD